MNRLSRTPSAETATDLTSVRSLNVELQEYLDRTNNAELLELYPGVERMEYDFIAERKNVYATNLVESTAHLIKGCLGAGILGIHEGYMYGGLWTSLVTNIFLGILVPYNMLLLVNSAQKMYNMLRVPKLSYPDLIETVVATGPIKCLRRMSKISRYSLDGFLFIGFCSTCCIYQIMMARTIKEVLESSSTTIKSWQIPIAAYTLIATVPLFSISMIRSLKRLAAFSMVADVFCAICVIITIYYNIKQRKPDEIRPAWKSFHGLFRFCGICIYSLDGIGVALPIENCMAEPQYFYIVVQWGMSVVLLAVASVGFFGYWSWGEDCRSPITIHMPKTISSTILQLFFALTLCVTFSVHLWVPFRTIWRYIGWKHKRHRGHWERFYRGIYVVVITCMSIVFSDLSDWMSFVGNFFLTTIALILPAFIDSLVVWQEENFRLKILRNIFIIAIGIIISSGAIYSYIE